MDNLIAFHQYRQLDDKSRALVRKYGAKCDDETYEVVKKVTRLGDFIEDCWTDSNVLCLLDREYRIHHREYRKQNRLFRTLFKACHK